MTFWYLAVMMPLVLLGASLASECTYPSPLKLCPFEQARPEFFPPESPPEMSTSSTVTDQWGHCYKATERGLVIENPNGRTYTLNGERGLPVEEVTCVTMAANGDLWMGTPRGAIRFRGGRFEYYASKRWLPHDEVQAIECLQDGSVRVYTPDGVSHIQFKTMTLEEKAEHYEVLTDTRHKRHNYVTGCHLPEEGDLSNWRNHDDDNDGLWTAMYVAAESFRTAVTGSEGARDKAREALKAILKLEETTSIEGFPARSLTHKSEPQFGHHHGGEWHRTEDGEWEWKGDTSSDEIVGHYFAWHIYYDLVADEKEKERICETCRRVTDHIVDNGFYLIDVDGKPTRWGVWAPEKLNKDLRWRGDQGLNSLEILSCLKVAHHLTGDDKYAEAAQGLIKDHHYAINTITRKILPEGIGGAMQNHSDDELAFLPYYNLLILEKDPELRSIYLLSLERSWQVERPEKCPLWNFIYGAVTRRPCDAEAAVESLQGIPLDLIEWRITNSHRADIEPNPHRGRHGELISIVPVPWPERPIHKWNGNPYSMDGGSGHSEECGTFWLLPYWMGRYHGIIE